MKRYQDASTERQRIRRIVRKERASYLAMKSSYLPEMRAIQQAVYVCDTILDAIAPRRRPARGGNNE